MNFVIGKVIFFIKATRRYAADLTCSSVRSFHVFLYGFFSIAHELSDVFSAFVSHTKILFELV